MIDDHGARCLAAAVIRAAVRDLQPGRPHCEQQAARRFLSSPWGRYLLDLLELNHLTSADLDRAAQRYLNNRIGPE